jgi:pilus assembly protein Flp/PilA
MRNFTKSLCGWLSIDSERGVTSIEYAILAMLISLVIVVAVGLVGTRLEAFFTTLAGLIPTS